MSIITIGSRDHSHLRLELLLRGAHVRRRDAGAQLRRALALVALLQPGDVDGARRLVVGARVGNESVLEAEDVVGGDDARELTARLRELEDELETAFARWEALEAGDG